MWLIVGQVIFLAVIVGIVVLFALDDRKSRKEREKEDRLEEEQRLARARIENKDKDVK